MKTLLLLLLFPIPISYSSSRFKWNWLTKVFRLHVLPFSFPNSFSRSYWIRNFSSEIIIVNKLTMNGFVFFSFFHSYARPTPIPHRYLRTSIHVVYYVSLHKFLFVDVQLHWYASSDAMLAECECGKSVCFWRVVKLSAVGVSLEWRYVCEWVCAWRAWATWNDDAIQVIVSYWALCKLRRCAGFVCLSQLSVTGLVFG